MERYTLSRAVMFASTARTSRTIGAINHLHHGIENFPAVPRWRPSIFRPAPVHVAHTIPTSLRPYSCKSGKTDAIGESQKAQGGHCASKSHPVSLLSLRFWTSVPIWRRAAVNTLRCLVGCTTGDFSAMWLLQVYYPEIGIGAIMGIAMASGLTTSMILETVLLQLGRDGLSWPAAAKTAAGMSLISMLTMEAAQNMVDYHLTGGTVAFDSPTFWAAAAISMAAGFLAPLPYNYLRLRKYGKACH